MDRLYPGRGSYLEDKKMNKKTYAFFLKKNRKKNPIAKVLKFFTPHIIEDKKKYNRKTDDQVWKKYFWKGF